MVVSNTKVRTILNNARETLKTAEFGLSMLQSADPVGRQVGLRNVVVFGRAVTNVLQKLRSVVLDFDEWYQPWQKRFGDDAVTSYMYKLRSEILKEGQLVTGRKMSFDLLTSTMIAQAAQNPPPRAKAFFVGDSLGGSGWEIELDSGETEKFYLSMTDSPGIGIKSEAFFANAPIGLNRIPVQDLCSHYIAEMKAITDDAWNKFVVQISLSVN